MAWSLDIANRPVRAVLEMNETGSSHLKITTMDVLQLIENDGSDTEDKE